MLSDIIKSGKLSSGSFDGGKVVQELERLVCNYTGARYCVAVSSGTAALHTVLECVSYERIAIPAFSFRATRNAVLAARKTPVYIDINIEDFTMLDLDLQTKEYDAVIPVHLYGHPCQIETNKPIIEDACQALGTFYNHKHLGTFGLAGCFSLYGSKIVSSGEGGLIVTDNEALAWKCKNFRNNGDVCSYGLNYRMSEIHAAIAIEQFKEIETRIELRKANYKKIKDKYPEYIKLKSGEAWNHYLHTFLGDPSLGTRYYDYTLAPLPNAQWASKNVVSINLAR